MKPLLILALIAATAAVQFHALADDPKIAEKPSGPVEKSAKPHKKAPPGQAKRGDIPPGKAKKQVVPTDLVLTNEPMTNLVARPHSEKPKVEDKRVESPRGAEALPVLRPEDTNKVTKPKPEPAAHGPVSAPTAKQEKELESDLQRVNATWINLTSRSFAIQKIADETGCPVATLNEQSKGNSKLRGSELLMANKIAALAARAPEDVLQAYAGSKQWLATGASLGADPVVLLESANRVSTALR